MSSLLLLLKVIMIVFGVISISLIVVWTIYWLAKKKQDVEDFDGKLRHYLTYFVIAIPCYSAIILYLIAIRENPGLSDKPWIGGGLAFFGLTLISGAVTELIYLALRLFPVIRQKRYEDLPEVDENGKKQSIIQRILKARTRVLDPMDKKRIDILVLIVMAVIMHEENDRSSFWFCIVLILNYFTWITVIPKEIGINLLNLLNMSLEVLTTIVLMVITIAAYFITITTIPTHPVISLIGYIVGMILAVFFLVYVYYVILPKNFFQKRY